MYNIKFISKLCESYPQSLLKLDDAPDILFAIGNLSLLNKFSLAVVGSRNFTSEAKVLTENLVQDLVAQDIVIISGMARGIDSIAHEACIKAGGKTIAILGCGLLFSEGKKMFNKILNNDGLIISEYFPDMPSYKSNFPKRNRLISGISNGVIVTEAREDSGSLITARHAFNQGKNVFTFPWNVDNDNYLGNNLLLTNGAKCIISYKNILDSYPNFITTSPIVKSPKNIPEEYSKIYKHLKKTPVEINLLAKDLNMSLSELQYKLTLMEIDGLVTKLPNNYFLKQ